jgi:ubiquinone/menaquinone biosynthesis C-methylase UbiE
MSKLENDASVDNSGRHQTEFDLFYKTIAPYVDIQGKKVLDLCCQWGGHMNYLVETGANMFGVDIADFSLKPHPRYNFLRSDAQNLALKSNSIDIVYCINAFEHIPDPEKTLNEIYRILRPGGFVFISFIPAYYSDVGSHMAEHVPEPWAHLIYSEDEYISKLRTATPGTEYWVQEYQNGLNRKTRSYFLKLFKQFDNNWLNRLSGSSRFEIMVKQEWSGVVFDSHLNHKNFVNLQKKYPKEDLLFQGMYILLKKKKLRKFSEARRSGETLSFI